MLINCGRIKKESFDNQTLKMIVQSIMKMQKSLDSNNAHQGIKLVLEDLSANLSSEVSREISPILESMSSEIQGFKDWLD